ncbi:MAG: Asp-tRNA(Asn)/Glu-tRNA(Gln) amidotransferase subunit GatB [Bacteroidota bacterium]
MIPYETVIGLEAHVQLSTASKAFCGDDTRFGAAPNTHLSAISLGLPGTLPRLNEKQLAYAIRIGLALGGTITRRTTFDRKNYFYADLPKGYQITQDAAPISIGGYLPIRLNDGTEKNIRIHHLHMEEDAGKSMHISGKNYSQVDLNRAGMPLLEIVTEPDLRSAEEVDAFMRSMRRLVRYLEISDGNMQEGSLRCDVNISLRPWGQEAYGTRCEIKNLNSMRYARQAISFEVQRQAELLDEKEEIVQETRQFDPQRGQTFSLRSKEDAHDYRYFADPDLPPCVVSEASIEKEKAQLATLPWTAYRELMKDYGLSAYDADLLSDDKAVFRFYQQLAAATDQREALAKLLLNKLLPWLQEQELPLADCPLSPPTIAAYLQLIADGQVATAQANAKLLPALLVSPEQAPAELAKKLGLIQNTDTDFLQELVQAVVAEFPNKVKAYQKGKKGLIGFFMGEVMKRSKGQAEPKATRQLLQQLLDQ